jgi:CAAX prenyl protease-like protein
VTPAPQWNPLLHFGNSVAGWFFITVRLLGSSIVVPPLEEVFYRSFLYRWITRPDFGSVPLGHFHWKAFLITALMFGFAHNEWLAAILCAGIYQGLVCQKKRLGDAIVAHAITNFLLGAWVVWKGAWHFW